MCCSTRKLCVAVGCNVLQYTRTHDLLTHALHHNLTCVLQCVAVCNDLLYLRVRCSVLQYTYTHDLLTRALRHDLTCVLHCVVAVCCSVPQYAAVFCSYFLRCSVLQYFCNMLQCTRIHNLLTRVLHRDFTYVLQRVEVCYSVLQYVAVTCALQCVVV